MHIEVLINGEPFTKFPVPDCFTERVQGVSWQESVDFRERIVAMYLEKTRKAMDKFLQPGVRLSFQLVFPSKMTTIEHEPDSERPDLPDGE